MSPSPPGTALPVRGPRIEILDSHGRPKSPKAQEISYAVGDKIELRCNSAPSKPAARLRWYLNDHELQVPNSNLTLFVGSLDSRGASGASNQRNLGYDVSVTPIEYRQHYKGIYSSHSTLSLVLQQDDLINSKISFKCLASLRQDVPIQSKQLIVLTPSQATISANARLARARRFLSDLVATLGDERDSEAHVHHRQRPQHQRHSVSRMPQSSSSLSSLRSQAQAKSSSELISISPEDSRNQMLYVYEDSDSTLGPSIIDRPETLESYLKRDLSKSDDNPSTAPEYNRADNLEYVQLLRERSSRQRSLLHSVQPTSSGSNHHSLKRIFGTNSLVKSPLYLDENDSLRPVINWPPLDSGKLMLLPPGNTIVAVPTYLYGSRRPNSGEQRFVLPSSRIDSMDSSNLLKNMQIFDSGAQNSRVMLERLIQNLNCTNSDGATDTKMSWIINDLPLSNRDTRFYPTRVSPDHRQTWISIGLQLASNPSSSPSSLQSILEKYYKNGESLSLNRNNNQENDGIRFDPKSSPINNQQLIPNDQLRFICQAVHSMLLYSSSEMITFDFNPPPLSSDNSIDKLNALPSNVIPATSASQSSSDAGWSNPYQASLGSHILFTITSLFSCIIVNRISTLVN